MADAAEVKFDAEQWERILKIIRGRWKDIEDRRKFGGIVASAVFRDVMDHFADQRGPDGSWSPWSKMYREHLDKIGKSGRNILQTGNPPRLRNNMSPATWRGTSSGVIFFNNAKTSEGFPYAAHHDEGPSDGSGPRKFMWISEKAMQSIIAQTEEFLAREESGAV